MKQSRRLFALTLVFTFLVIKLFIATSFHPIAQASDGAWVPGQWGSEFGTNVLLFNMDTSEIEAITPTMTGGCSAVSRTKTDRMP